MTDHVYKDEAIARSITYSSRGHKVSFELDPEGWERLKELGEGQRYAMVLVPIAEDQTPDRDAAQKVRRRASEMPRSQYAGILCNDPEFQRWLEAAGYCSECLNADDAAETIREWCDSIATRAELNTNPEAGRLWDELVSEYRRERRE